MCFVAPQKKSARVRRSDIDKAIVGLGERGESETEGVTTKKKKTDTKEKYKTVYL